jgi:hypothetical protein
MDNKMGEEKVEEKMTVEDKPKEVKLTEVSITDEVVALNILVSFLNLGGFAAPLIFLVPNSTRPIVFVLGSL